MTLDELVRKIGMEEAIKLVKKELNWSEEDFRFILAIERGEITGDVQVIDANRKA